MADTPQDNPKAIVQKWIKELDAVENSKSQKAFENIGERIVKNYRNADSLVAYDSNNKPNSVRVMLNILWSNVKILKPIYFCRLPKVQVDRVFKDSDKVGAFSCEIAERATEFQILRQQDKAKYAIAAAVEDRLLPGRGQVWLRYAAEFEEEQPEGGIEPIIDEDSSPIKVPKPNSEKVEIDPLNWLDYLESIARNQYEVRWRSRKLRYSRAELIDEFGEEIGKAVPLNFNPTAKRKMSREDEEIIKQAEVYLIQDLTTKTFYWINKDYLNGPLKMLKDPLRLEGFFSCPRPLLATTTTDSTYPTPDFKIYEKLADEADNAFRRLADMVDCVRYVGATSSAFTKDVKNVLKLGNGNLWPVDNWANWVEKGGFKGVMDWLPFDNAIAAIPVLAQHLDYILGKIDLILGIPDIVRGNSDAQESASAIQQKSHWILSRVQEDQQEVQRFCREICSKICEIIFEPGLFSDETIAMQIGLNQMSEEKQAMFPDALALLRDDRLRTFRIDIETDSTIAADDENNINNWKTYLESIQAIMGQLETVKQYQPEFLKPMLESCMGAVRVLRTGRAVEGAWEQALDEIDQNAKQAAANPQPPPPDPALIQAQAYAQDLQMKAQNSQQESAMKMQIEQMKSQSAMQDAQIKEQELQLKFQEMQNKNNIDMQTLQQGYEKIQLDFEVKTKDLEVKGLKIQSEAEMQKMGHDLEQFREQFNAVVATKRLELEKFATLAAEKDRLLQAAKHDSEQRMQALQMVHEHALQAKDISHNLEITKIAAKPATAHTGSKTIRIKRNPVDGSMDGKIIPDKEGAKENKTEGGIEE